MAQTPLLILSDAIAGSTGLGRVARDLAIRIHVNMSDIYRVGTLGVGGHISTSSRFPFPNYSIRQLDSGSAHATPPLGLLPLDLPTVWEDFAGRYGDGRFVDSPEDYDKGGQLRRGICLAIWNVSWCGWLAHPDWLPNTHPLRQFLLPPSAGMSGGDLSACPIQRWLYCPVDGHCPDGTLGPEVAPILAGFDRLLAYTRYGSEVMEKTLRKWAGVISPAVSHLPHGIDTAVFYPRPRDVARHNFLSYASRGQRSLPLNPDQILLGAVATNTPRKDWGLAFETCAELLSRDLNVYLWCHTDNLTGGYWNLPSLARQFGMENRVVMTTERFGDEEMAWMYSACDCTLGIGSEGWGYPLSESLTCGTPVVHMGYAGGAEFTEPALQAAALGYRQEGRWSIQRPVFSPSQWADKVERAVNETPRFGLSLLPEYIEWDNAWPRWQEWLAESGKMS